MNYSDYDSDGYTSKEDEDYLPSEENLSEDDINDCIDEEPLEEDSAPRQGVPGRKMKGKKELSVRWRKKGVLKLEQEDMKGAGVQGAASPKKEELQRPPVKERVEDEEEEEEARLKKKSDDLWASFLSDVGSRPRDSAVPPSGPSQKPGAPVKMDVPPRTQTSDTAKVTITSVMDFAGEEVRVQRVVSADSKEAKSFLKKHQVEEKKTTTSESPTASPGPSGKRVAGLSNVLGRLGVKKQKMSTLEKSKMDWDTFKSEEGITEELAIHNRGREGYVERKNFLDRVDHRQFELEKAVRLSNMKQ